MAAMWAHTNQDIAFEIWSPWIPGLAAIWPTINSIIYLIKKTFSDVIQAVLHACMVWDMRLWVPPASLGSSRGLSKWRERFWKRGKKCGSSNCSNLLLKTLNGFKTPGCRFAAVRNFSGLIKTNKTKPYCRRFWNTNSWASTDAAGASPLCVEASA